MTKFLPLLLLLFGSLAGFGAGHFLGPEDLCKDYDAADSDLAVECFDDAVSKSDPTPEEQDSAVDFVRMNDQFVIPVLENGVVQSLVVMSITLEVASGESAAVFAIEPKVRDGLLRILFDHANAGGFRGNYTQTDQVESLRRALLERAQSTGGTVIRNVLILDLLRQDV